MKPVIRKPWERTRVIADITSESKTIQDVGNDTNINNIVARFARTGIMPPGNTAEPNYGDFTKLQGDLTEIIEKGRKAEKEYQKLQLQHEKAEEKRLADIEATNASQAARLAELEALHGEPSPT